MDRRILYACGMLSPLLYIFMYILGGALRPGYSQIADSVSELVSPGAPNKPLLSVIHVAYAVLSLLFGIGVFQFVRGSEYHGLTGTIGAGMIIAVGAATVGTIIFPQDAMGAPPTIPGQIHKILVFGVLLPFSVLSTLLIGIWLRRTAIWPGFGTYSFITVGAIVLSGGLAGATVGTPIMGLVERTGAFAAHQWLFVLALLLFFR